MKNSIIKKALALVCALAMVFTLCACGSQTKDGDSDSAKVYKVGICNYVDDASLNQIVDFTRKPSMLCTNIEQKSEQGKFFAENAAVTAGGVLRSKAAPEE